MTTDEIRKAFLNFFKSKEHKIIKSSSLIPEEDSTILFTNAGMNQFKKVFLDLNNYPYKRVATIQRCLRVGGKHNDLDKVGYTTQHHTFFEMLGNFSFGDYFKEEAIYFSWELLTSKKWFNLPKDRLRITVYDNDEETYNIWNKKILVPDKYIFRIGDYKGKSYVSDNFWQMSDTGPCGPCSEIFYDKSENNKCLKSLNNISNICDLQNCIEIWNLVFIQFNKLSNGTLLPLKKPSVDTGMGLERIASVLQKVNSNYEIDFFKKLINYTTQTIKIVNFNIKSINVIADHVRACIFLINDGIVPSNEGRGYILRKIIRRAIIHGNFLGIKDIFFYKLVKPIVELISSEMNELECNTIKIEKILMNEEVQFSKTLKSGLKMLLKELKNVLNNTLDGKIAFKLHDTYGFPLDLTIDVCRNYKLYVDEDGFKSYMKKQSEKSRHYSTFINRKNNKVVDTNKVTNFFGYSKFEHTGLIIDIFRDGKSVDSICCNETASIILDETSFYGESGGQVGDCGQLKNNYGTFEVINTYKFNNALIHFGKITYGKLELGMQVLSKVNKLKRVNIQLNHSATHLLHESLRKLLGKNIKQCGSFINDKYLRFDFSYNKKVELEQIVLLEKMVNEQIRNNLKIKADLMTLEDARKNGAIALFDNKYKKQEVRVLSIGKFSIELCCGTHTNRTGDIGLFHITSNRNIAENVHRIEAVTGIEALSLFSELNNLVYKLSSLMKTNKYDLLYRIQKLYNESYHLKKTIHVLDSKQAMQESKLLIYKSQNIKGIKVIIDKLDNYELKFIKLIINYIKDKLKNLIIVIFFLKENEIKVIVRVTKNLTNKIKANDIINFITSKIGGKGGGKSDLAQAGGISIQAYSDKILSKIFVMLNNII